MQTLKLRHEALVHALASKLWKVLTSAEYTAQFLFDGIPVSEWTEGSPIYVEKEQDGGNSVVQSGLVEKVLPGLVLRFRLDSPEGIPGTAVSYQYELAPGDGGVQLFLTQEAEVLSPGAWQLLNDQGRMLLQTIKWLAEFG